MILPQRRFALIFVFLFCRLPLAADRRHYGTFLLQGIESLVDHFTVKAGHFGHFAGIHGSACLTHGLQHLFFCFHFSII